MMVNADVPTSILVKKNSAITATINPGITSARGPYASNKRPVNGDIKPFSTPPGSNTNPAENAASAKLFCKYSGSKIIVERIIIKLINTKISPNVNIGYLNTFKSIKGFSIVSWRQTKSPSASPPTIIETNTVALPQPLSPALLKANTTPPKPSVERIIDKISIFGFVTTETFCINFIPNNKAIIRNGKEIQKIQFQVKFSKISPEIVGPTAGANIITSPIIPIAEPRLCSGKISKIVLNINGSNSAVPTACTTRPIINIANVGESAAMSVPAIEKLTAVKNKPRVVNHCKSNPEIGTNIPSVSK